MLRYDSITNQVKDKKRLESPYEDRNLFAAAPVIDDTRTGTVQFVCNNSLIWNNTGKAISQIQIDFDDTYGFNTITIGTPITVNYADTGIKQWTIKVTFTDNSVWQCYSSYYVARVVNNNMARYQPGGFGVNGFDFTHNFNANANHDGGRIFIAYTSLNRTNTIRKPLIVVEGYDVGNIIRSVGNTSYRDFILSINNEPVGYDFNEQLDEVAGYDLIYVDFNNGTDDIRRNAALVEEIIDWVNTHKVPNNNNGNIMEENVVLGISMGGLVARYALAEMTKNNVATETRLLITHDSPHKGANVPLGLQYLIRMTGGVTLFNSNIRDIYPEYDQTISLLDEEATKQMLIYRSTSINTMTTNTFLDGDYRNMITFSSNDPQPTYRFIATSNGSECGHEIFAPYENFLTVTGKFGLSVIIASYNFSSNIFANALPAQGSTNMIAQLNIESKAKLFFFINLHKYVFNETAYAPGSHLPIDGVPGGLNPFSNRIPLFSLSVGRILYVNLNTTDFSFVPTVSALDISPFNLSAFSQDYVNGVSPTNYLSKTNTFIAQETVSGIANVPHTLFTARNAEWMFNEMEELPNTLNCSNECSNPYYIQGQNNFCNTSDIYFISGLQRGASITWSVFPSGIVNITSPNSLTTTLTKITDGQFTLTATISNACGGTIQVHKLLVAGPPLITILGPYDPVQHTIMGVACVGEEYYFIASDSETGQTYTWTLFPPSGSGEFPRLFSGSQVQFDFVVPGYHTLRVTKTNSCGSTYTDMTIHVQRCFGFRLSASPNPATNQVVVTIDEENSEVKSLSVDTDIKFELHNFNTGVNQKQWTYKNAQNKFTLNLTGISSGTYVLRATKGKYQQAIKIIIN